MIFRGIIFDFDGTIFDSEVPEYEAWAEIFARYGATLPITEWGACIGSSNDTFDVIACLEAQHKQKVDGDALYRLHRKLSDERSYLQEALPGVEDVIHQARLLDLQLAIASSSPRDWVDLHLKRLKLEGFIKIICSADDVTHVKPDPELFLCATRKMGLTADEVIVFEDSPNGITAAIRAGMVCVAIPNGVTRNLNTSHATRSFKSMAEINLEMLLNGLEFR